MNTLLCDTLGLAESLVAQYELPRKAVLETRRLRTPILCEGSFPEIAGRDSALHQSTLPTSQMAGLLLACRGGSKQR